MQKPTRWIQAAGAATLLFAAAAAAQTPQQRQVNIKVPNLYAPIQFSAVVDRGTSYATPRGAHQSAAFQDASPDWIASVSITIVNNSVKDIVAVEFMVYVPTWEKDPNRPQTFVRFHEGQLPERALHFGDGTLFPEESSLALDIKPGASADIPLKQGFAKLSEALRHNPALAVPLASVNSIWIQPERIFFADGTMWGFNTYMKPDAARPAHYLPITKEEWASGTSR